MTFAHQREPDSGACREECRACCYDLLLLVTERRVGQAVVKRWTARERIEASAWAADEHSGAASAHGKSLPMPAHVAVAVRAARFANDWDRQVSGTTSNPEGA